MSQIGLIAVNTELSGAPLYALLDTGVPVLSWPRQYCLKGDYTGSLIGVQGIASEPRDAEIVILPTVKVGEWTFRNVASQSIVPRKDMAGLNEDGCGNLPEPDTWRINYQDISGAIPILGNNLFDGLILTIDTRHSRLMIRSGDEDFIHNSAKPEDIVLDLIRQPIELSDRDPDEPTLRGMYMLFRGTVNGHPTRIVLDTACGVRGLMVTAALRRTAGLAQKDNSSIPMGDQRKKLPMLKGVKWKLEKGPEHHTPVIVMDASEPNFDRQGIGALVGYYLLERYELTIDYRRDKALLRPYRGSKPK